MNIDTSTQAILRMLIAGVAQTILVTALAYALATLLAVPIGYCRPVSYTHLDVYKRQP